MVFHNYRAVFFHIGKTAGHSIEHSLLPAKRDYRVFHEKILYGLKDGVMTQHLTPKGMPRFLGGQGTEIVNYYWFTFVRNPWDRMASEYFYLYPYYKKTFGEFSDYLKAKKDIVIEKRYKEGDHLTPQVEYTHDESGKQVVDFIGRFESLEEDWITLTKKIRAYPLKLKNINKSAAKKEHYSTYYDDESIEIVKEMYPDDIDKFKYTFNDKRS